MKINRNLRRMAIKRILKRLQKQASVYPRADLARSYASWEKRRYYWLLLHKQMDYWENLLEQL